MQGEHELAVGDVDLPAAEAHGIDPVLQLGHRCRPAPPRRPACKGWSSAPSVQGMAFAAPLPVGGQRPSGAPDCRLHVAPQEPISIKAPSFRSRALSSTLIEPRRSGMVPSPEPSRRGRRPLPHQARKGRLLFAVEIALEAVAPASFSKMPGSPGPSATSSRAGGGTATGSHRDAHASRATPSQCARPIRPAIRRGRRRPRCRFRGGRSPRR